MEEGKIYCVECGSVKKSRYCEKCKKETSNLLKRELTTVAHHNISLGAKQKRPGVGFIKKMFQGFRPSMDPKLPNGVDVQMTADIEGNKYDHVVIDKNTGEVIHEEHESLTEHNAKRNKGREN